MLSINVNALKSFASWQDELESCFIYQVGALDGFLKRYGLPMNHVRFFVSNSTARWLKKPQIKPHGSVYGQTARSIDLARAVVGVTEIFKSSAASAQGVAFMGLAGTAHQQAAEELGVPFIAGPSLLYCFA